MGFGQWGGGKAKAISQRAVAEYKQRKMVGFQAKTQRKAEERGILKDWLRMRCVLGWIVK